MERHVSRIETNIVIEEDCSEFKRFDDGFPDGDSTFHNFIWMTVISVLRICEGKISKKEKGTLHNNVDVRSGC